MEHEDLRRTREMPIVERNGGNAWLYLHDPLGVFSHRRDDMAYRELSREAEPEGKEE